MANIITTLSLEMSENWYVSKKLSSVGRVGENTVTKLTIEPTEIIDNVTYELEIMSADGSKNVAELTIDGTELYLILTANMLTTSGIVKMQVRAVFADGSIKKSNIFELKVNRSISATEHYEEYAVTIFDQLVQDCRDIIEDAESYAIRAETAAVNAEAYEQSASVSAEAASASEATATSASTAAVNAAASAETSANTASASAETATTEAASASTSASTATAASETAQTASTTAQSASETAVNASIVATTAQTSAETAANSASTSANNASASATAASTSAANAATSASNASASATNAATSETNAANSATSAANLEASASASATNAANSATAAATSASNAATSEANASTSETNASTSATEAAASAETVASSIAQINENTYRINDLEAIIGGYTLTDLPTGAVATITNGTALLMPSLKIGIEPVQDLNGYDHPWAGGGGKNLANIADRSGITSQTQLGTVLLSAGTYTLSAMIANSGIGGVVLKATNATAFSSNPAATSETFVKTSLTFTITEETEVKVAAAASVSGYNGSVKEIQLEQGSTATSYEPYSNICPISGWTATNVVVSPTTSAEDGTTYNIQFVDGENPLTVYGGNLNVITGLLTVTDAYIASYAGETLPSTWISDRDVYAEGTTPTTGAQVVYTLETALTYQLTPTQIRTLVGTNNIWADTGDIIEGKYYGS